MQMHVMQMHVRKILFSSTRSSDDVFKNNCNGYSSILLSKTTSSRLWSTTFRRGRGRFLLNFLNRFYRRSATPAIARAIEPRSIREGESSNAPRPRPALVASRCLRPVWISSRKTRNTLRDGATRNITNPNSIPNAPKDENCAIWLGLFIFGVVCFGVPTARRLAKSTPNINFSRKQQLLLQFRLFQGEGGAGMEGGGGSGGGCAGWPWSGGRVCRGDRWRGWGGWRGWRGG